MDRRTFLMVLSGGLLAAPLAAEAQQAGKVYRIGLLQIETREVLVPYLKAFEEGLRELGYVEGRDFVREYRFADRQRERLPDLAAELVRLKVDVIVTGLDPGTMAARQATTTIPIVMVLGTDPVGLGLIASVRRPGGNVTGLRAFVGFETYGKRLQLLKEVVPSLSRVAGLWNPDLPGNVALWEAAEEGARRLGLTLLSVEVREPREIEGAFAKITQERAQALFVVPDGFALLVNVRRPEIQALAAKNRLPSIYAGRESVEAGGLMSYATSTLDLFRRAARYVDKILKGAKPGDLPVEQPTKWELVINLKTAKALGLTIPQSLLGRADQLIE
jgi:putative ABC transport system substrate-binding protein